MIKDRTYWMLAAVMILLGAGMLILPAGEDTEELSPYGLYRALLDDTRYQDVDRVSKRIIEEDPSLLLIDVRDTGSYRSFSLPGAVNIPLDYILDPVWADFLGAEGMDKVFFSYDDLHAGQAWLLCRRLGFTDLYVMKGGLNTWADLILSPEPPAESDPEEKITLYQFRLGASRFFTGDGNEIVSARTAEPVPVVRRERKSVIQGGC